MADPNITMEEYIELEAKKARRRGHTFNWETATYVSPLDDNKIDFKISFDESDDEDYIVSFDKKLFSYKLIYVDDLKTGSENDNDEVNLPSDDILIERSDVKTDVLSVLGLAINWSNGRLDSCLVIPPPKGKKPKAIIKFLGGAFIGAVPEVTYGYSLGLLANKGYLIISVPYNVTFDHSQAAREVFERFHSCLNSVLTYGLLSDGLLAAELVDLPLYSVGHSNGALLQVLYGSYFSDKLPKANAIISYNSPQQRHYPTSSRCLKALLDTDEAMAPDYDPETRVSLDKFVDQLPSVFNQVKFNTDAIDETNLLEETLRPHVEAIGGTLDTVSLSGNHITPCIQDTVSLSGNHITPCIQLGLDLVESDIDEKVEDKSERVRDLLIVASIFFRQLA
ncbi:alpha/beta hydrolase fold protein [Tanacetum coccineum]